MNYHTIFRVSVPNRLERTPVSLQQHYDIYYFTANGLIEWVDKKFNEKCHELWAAQEYLIEDQDCLVDNLFLHIAEDQEITNDE